MAQGLSSLLSDSHLTVSNKVASFKGVKSVPIKNIRVNSKQPRKKFDEGALEELAASIKVHGVIQPITIREIEGGKYELISGERRWRASQLAGLESIPAFMRNVGDEKSLELGLIENLQREDLNPIEIALAYNRMMEECKLKQEELGERVGKKRSTVTNYLRLLLLPEEIQTGLVSSEISMGQARPLIPINDKDLQLKVYHKIVQEGLSVRKVEALLSKKATPKIQALEDHKEDIRLFLMAEKKNLNVPIKIEVKDLNKGNVCIPIENEEDLQELIELINS